MRGGDDRAAANQRAIDALFQARLQAVFECKGRLEPSTTSADSVYPVPDEIDAVHAWDHLNVSYLLAEWPPSKMN
jgi:hypothetical protein